MRCWLASVLLLTGCVRPDLQRCGDLLCSADSICLNNSQCATPDLIEACNGLTEGTACSTLVFMGTCQGGICTAPRCGDGLVTGSEQCDGRVSGVDCVTYGFDTGVPSCTAACTLDVVDSCVRFGWEQVSSAVAELAWTDGSSLAVVPPDRMHVTLYRGTQTITTATNSAVHALAANDRSVAVATNGEILRSTDGAAFSPIELGPIPAAQYEIVYGLSFFVAIFEPNSTRIWQEVGDGAWQNILTNTETATVLKLLGSFLYVGYANGEVRRWSGNWSSTLFTAPGAIKDISEHDGTYFVSTATGNYEVTGTTITQLWNASFPSALFAGDAAYFGGDDIGVLRRTTDSLDVLDAPIFGRLMTDTFNLYIYGNGVYRYTGTEFARRMGVAEPAADAALFASGDIGIASFSEVLTIASPEAWNHASPQQTPVALAGRSKNDYYVSGTSVVEHWNGSQLSPIAMPLSIPPIADLAWQDSTSTLYAVGAQGLVLQRIANNWTPFGTITGCDLHAIALRTMAYIAGTCGTEGVVWRWSGTAWVELHREPTPLVALWVDEADNVYAAGPDGGAVRVLGTWRSEPQARGISISATNPGDIWVGGGPGDLVHFDGSAWSRVRIVGAASPRVVATPRAVYIAGATTSVLVR